MVNYPLPPQGHSQFCNDSNWLDGPSDHPFESILVLQMHPNPIHLFVEIVKHMMNICFDNVCWSSLISKLYPASGRKQHST